MIFIYGAIASGKSEYAERLALSLGGERVYLATMEVRDREDLLRVERHRRLREGKGFRTIERSRDISGAGIDPGEVVLLECLSSLLAAEMFCRGEVKEAGEVEKKLYHDIISLDKNCRELIVVGSDVSRERGTYDEAVHAYIQALEGLQAKLRGFARESREIVCGLEAGRDENNNVQRSS